ncbi:MAG: ABC transporter substrate-binding protein [Anaerolineae bacterium]
MDTTSRPIRLFSRRTFLSAGLLTGVGVALSACVATPAPAATTAPEATTAPVEATAAATPAAAGGEKVVIKVFECCWDGEHIDAGKKLYEQWRQEHPNIDAQDFWPPGDWAEDFLASWAAGDHWDVTFWCMSPWKFMDEGKCLDLNPLLEADTTFDQSDFYDYMRDMWLDDEGHRFGWPANYATTLMYWNTKMFAEAGVNPPDQDYTWDDLLEMAQKLTKDTGDPATTKFGYVFRPVDVEHMVQSFGGNFVDPDAKRCDFTKPESVEGLQFFSDLIFKHKVCPQQAQMAGQDHVAMFASQRVAMVSLPEWGLNEFLKAHAEEGLEFDVLLMPKGPVKRTTRVRPSAASIFSVTEHPSEAWEVMKFILSPEYEKRMMVELPESPPSRISVNQYKIDQLGDYPKNKAVFVESPKYGIFPYYDKRYGKEMQDTINPILDLLFTGAETDMQALAAKACQDIDAKFAEL